MKLRKTNKLIGIISLTALLTLPIPFGSALAQDDTQIVETSEAEVTLIGGNLEFDFNDEHVYTFEDVELASPFDNIDQKTLKVEEQTIRDARGTGEGYNLTVVATQFEGHNTSEKLDPGTLSIVAPQSEDFTRVNEGRGFGNGEINNGTHTIDDGSKTLLSADQNAGMGVNTFIYSQNSLLFDIIQSDAKADKYASTITFTLSSGPNKDW